MCAICDQRMAKMAALADKFRLNAAETSQEYFIKMMESTAVQIDAFVEQIRHDCGCRAGRPADHMPPSALPALQASSAS